MAGNGSASTKHISAQLLVVILPMMIVAIAIVTMFISLRAKNIIEEEATNGLYQESQANASYVSGKLDSIRVYFDGICDTVQNTEFGSDQEIVDTFAFTMNQFDETPSGFYIGFSNKEYVDVSGWVPAADYDPTSRPWYTQGQSRTAMGQNPPSMDLTTGEMASTISQSIKMKDGRTGVMSSDVFLNGISKTTSAFKPLGTGSTMMFSGSMMVASPSEDQIGKDVSDFPDDSFIQ